MGFNYKIKTISSDTYELSLIFPAGKKIINQIVKATNKAMGDKAFLEKYNEKETFTFKIPKEKQENMFNQLKLITSKPFSKISKIVKNDGLILLNGGVCDATYHKLKSQEWLIEVVYTGQHLFKE